MEKTKLYKVGFFTSLVVIIALSIALAITSTRTVKEVEAAEETSEYGIEDEISAGRLAYGAFYDSVIEEVKPKFYGIYFKGNDTFDFYEYDHTKLENTDSVTKDTPKSLAYSIRLTNPLEVGTGVDHLKSIESYAYGTVFQAEYTTASGNTMPATVVFHAKMDYVTIYLHSDGNIDRFGDDKKLSSITISLEEDVSTFKSFYSYIRLRDITTVGEALDPSK